MLNFLGLSDVLGAISVDEYSHPGAVRVCFRLFPVGVSGESSSTTPGKLGLLTLCKSDDNIRSSSNPNSSRAFTWLESTLFRAAPHTPHTINHEVCAFFVVHTASLLPASSISSCPNKTVDAEKDACTAVAGGKTSAHRVCGICVAASHGSHRVAANEYRQIAYVAKRLFGKDRG